MKDYKRVGIFGGTFNPVHNGHLINAEIIREKFSLDKILFVPSKFPVHKDLVDNVSSRDRFRMLELAVSDNRGFEVSGIEIGREESSYTIYTVVDLIECFPGAEFSLIIGHDSYTQLHTWRDYEKLLRIVHIVVMRRAGENDHLPAIDEMAKKIDFAENPVIDISSTDIREKLRNGRSIKYLVPDRVITYINRKGLYKN